MPSGIDVVRWMQFVTPVVFIAWIGLSAWIVPYEICWRGMILPAMLREGWFGASQSTAPSFAAGITLLILSALLELAWVVPGIWVVLAGRFFKHSEPFAKPKTFMVVADRRSVVRPVCKHCSLPKSDRVSHRRWKGINRCIPLVDHTCGFYQSPICLHNQKAYLLSLLFVVLHQHYCTGLGIWAAVAARRSTLPSWWFPVLYLSAVFSLWTTLLVITMWERIAFKNQTIWDTCNNEMWIMCRNYTGVACHREMRELGVNPWDMGWKQNLHQTFGGWRDCLLFWRASPRQRYYQEDHDLSDWPLGAWATHLEQVTLGRPDPATVEATGIRLANLRRRPGTDMSDDRQV